MNDRVAMTVFAAAFAAALVMASVSGRAHADEPDANPAGAPAVVEALDRQIEVLARTETLLNEKYQTRSAELRRRVRAAYKLLRAGRAPMWVDKESRVHMTRRRAVARRVLSRDRAELGKLIQELESVTRARERLERERIEAAAILLPAPGSLQLPVDHTRVAAPFGTYRHDASRARLQRRGIALSSQPGHEVRAVADGVVRYAGPVRGLGSAVIVDHGEFWSILGHLQALDATRGATRGATVTRGAKLGQAAGEQIYVEIRLEVGAGYPLDPTPLFDWP